MNSFVSKMARIVCIFVLTTYCLSELLLLVTVNGTLSPNQKQSVTNGHVPPKKQRNAAIKQQSIAEDWPSDYSRTSSSGEPDNPSDKDWSGGDGAEGTEDDSEVSSLANSSSASATSSSSSSVEQREEGEDDEEESLTIRRKMGVVVAPRAKSGKKKAVPSSSTQAVAAASSSNKRSKQRQWQSKRAKISAGKETKQRDLIDSLDEIEVLSDESDTEKDLADINWSDFELSSSLEKQQKPKKFENRERKGQAAKKGNKKENVATKSRGKRLTSNSLELNSSTKKKQRKLKGGGEEAKRQSSAEEAAKKGMRQEKVEGKSKTNNEGKQISGLKLTQRSRKDQQQKAKTAEGNGERQHKVAHQTKKGNAAQQQKPTASGQAKAMEKLCINDRTPKSTPKRKRN